MGREDVFNRARFGDFHLDMRIGEVQGPGGSALLPQQVFHVLLLLVEREGELVTREELKKKLWPNDTVVEFEHLINNTIKKLRRVLNDAAEQPKYIGTVPRRGYRLLVPVEWEGPADDPRDARYPAELSKPSDANSEPTPKAVLKVGRLTGKIVSHYRVLEVIGGGGMGLVYRAEDLKLGRAVALKFLPEEVGDDPRARERFEREAHAVSALDHPNICTAYDFDEHEGHPFIAMQLLQGKTLRDHLAAGRFRLTQPEGLEVAIQIASGLEAAHEKGIIHRDIKPANIFITEKNVAKILDFGVAKMIQVNVPESQLTKRRFSGTPESLLDGVILSEESPGSAGTNGVEEPAVSWQGEELQVPRLSAQQGGSLGMTNKISAGHGAAEAVPFQPNQEAAPYTPEGVLHPVGAPAAAPAPAKETALTRTGMKLGTAGYMSPEQIRGEPLDARTDIFSFGLVLYEMATGIRAFSGETEAILHNAIQTRRATPARELTPEVSPKLELVILKCLEKDRDQRFQAMWEVANELTQSEDQVDPVADELEAREEVKRNGLRTWYVVGGCVLLLAIISTVVFRRMHYIRKLTIKDAVVLAEFENKTSDPLFDGTFQPALETAFGQTPFLNPLSPEKIAQTLRSLNKPVSERLTSAVARDVCLRTGSTAFITGSISDAGNQYRIELRALDCKAGGTLAESSATAEQRNRIVDALGVAAYTLRNNLGEPAASLRVYNKPLAEATTPSLEALQALAEGRSHDKTPEAVTNFKRALELDPNFALAHDRLSLCYTALRQTEPFRQELIRAYELRERRLSHRDRLAIEGVYYFVVTGEQEKVLSSAKEAVREFPQWGRAYHLLGLALAELGEYQAASEVQQDALRLLPDNVSSYSNLANTYIALNRLADAKHVLDEGNARQIDGSGFHEERYRSAFLQNDRQGMDEQVKWATMKPGVVDFLLQQRSQTEAYQGRSRKSEAIAQQAIAAAMKAGVPDRAADWASAEALTAALTGSTNRVPELTQRVTQFTTGASPNLAVALALVVSGDSSRALAIAQRADEQMPRHFLIQHCQLPVIRAKAKLQQNNADAAVEELQNSEPREFPQACRGFWAYARGETYLQSGKTQEAATAFHWILGHPGIWANSIAVPLSHLQLARAQVMMGDRDAARKSYQDFLTLWKDADPDIPVYKEAKTEYRNLQ